MKNLCLILICCLLSICDTKAQSVDDKVATKLTGLHKKGINSIILYHAYCTGMFYRKPDTINCFPDPDNIKYLLWKEKGSNYIQRFDGCYNYLPVDGKSELAFKLLSGHLGMLTKETIKGVQYLDPNDQQLKPKGGGDHGCYVDMIIYTGSKKINKHINYFDLYTEFTDDYTNPKIKRANINYTFNQHTHLKTLNDIIKKEVATLQFPKAN